VGRPGNRMKVLNAQGKQSLGSFIAFA
jgi:hypothetical protein